MKYLLIYKIKNETKIEYLETNKEVEVRLDEIINEYKIKKYKVYIAQEIYLL